MLEQILPSFNLDQVLQSTPMLKGHSKILYKLNEHYCLVKLIPSLSSFTFNRYETMIGTEVLRLDFYERAAQKLEEHGISLAFKKRIAPDAYIAEICSNPPFEVIIKNAAQGSTVRKYPGLFVEGHRFKQPVVKFDFRIDPEDQPIAEDYLREAGIDPYQLKVIALQVNTLLKAWLAPRNLLDFCIIIGQRPDGTYCITSEISPDCMRLRSPDGQSLDKDLFRQGASQEQIVAIWSTLIEDIRKI